MSKRQTQMAEAIAHMAADFFARESNGESLITVTRADISPDLKNIKIYISVLPIEKEKAAIAFAKRVRTDFREYLKSKSALNVIPTVDFIVDLGEKNRQSVDEAIRRSS